MRGIIYKYECPNKKVYIGQTTNETSRMEKFYAKGKYSGVKIDKARAEINPANFKYEVLFEIISDDKLLVQTTLSEKELYYINIYDSIDNGYNSTSREKRKLLSYEEYKELMETEEFKRMYELFSKLTFITRNRTEEQLIYFIVSIMIETMNNKRID